MRLIDADRLKQVFDRNVVSAKVFFPLIDNAPTVEQRDKGYWIIDEYEYLDCSCCGESYYTGCDCTEDAEHRLKTGDVYKFCPYCGARMDGEQK